MTLKLVFMGTPDFAVPVLSELVGQGHDIAAVYAQPARPAGRGQKPKPSAVEAAAQTFGLVVETPKTLKDGAAQLKLAAYAPDAIIVVAYGQILPPPVLAIPRFGCINLHASLLPRWRGAAPINRAIMSGDKETGVCTMLMDEGLDTGDVLMCERTAISERMTAGQLHDVLAERGASLMIRTLGALERGGLAPEPQPETGITYAEKIQKSEGRINWYNPAEMIDQQIRGLTPFPGAFCQVPDPKGQLIRLRIINAEPTHGDGVPGEVLKSDGLLVACAQGALKIRDVQRPGKEPMGVEAFLRGFDLGPGQILPSQ